MNNRGQGAYKEQEESKGTKRSEREGDESVTVEKRNTHHIVSQQRIGKERFCRGLVRKRKRLKQEKKR